MACLSAANAIVKDHKLTVYHAGVKCRTKRLVGKTLIASSSSRDKPVTSEKAPLRKSKDIPAVVQD
jgi:hypothetical protein